MKISNSKKITAVLSVILSIFMVFTSIYVTAFADSSLVSKDACFELVFDGTQAKLYAKNCQNLASGNISFKFNSNVVTKVRFTKGAEAKQVNSDNFENNSFTSESNPNDVTCVRYGFYFKDTLWSSAKFAENDLSGKANINGEYFHMATLLLTLADGKTEDDIQVSFSGSVTFTDGITKEKPQNFSMNVVNKSTIDEPTTEEPSTEEPSTEEPTTEPAIKPDNTNDDYTSDNFVGFVLTLDGTDVKLYAKNCIGLSSSNIYLGFDTDVVSKVRCTSGSDAKMVNSENFDNNSFNAECNSTDITDVKYGFYFKDYLWSSEKFAENDLSGKANINGGYFHIATFKLTLANGKTADDIKVSITGSVKFNSSVPQNFIYQGIELGCATANCKHNNAKSVKATAATCVSTGFTAGVYCEICSTWISGHEEVAIDSSSHVNTKTVSAVEATYTQVGYTRGVYCNDCKKYVSGHDTVPMLVASFDDNDAAFDDGDNIMANIDITIEQILTQSAPGSVVKDSDGNEVTDSDTPIATGMIIIYPDGTIITIVVNGDVDGNGKITAADARLALRASVELENFEDVPAFEKAIDVNGDGKSTATDARSILRCSVKLDILSVKDRKTK